MEIEGDEDIHTANEEGSGTRRHGHCGKITHGEVEERPGRDGFEAVVAGRGARYDHCSELVEDARDVAGSDLAQGALMPGYTHLQRAQPVRYFALAHVAALGVDERRCRLWMRCGLVR